jgi:hypothetical protein
MTYTTEPLPTQAKKNRTWKDIQAVGGFEPTVPVVEEPNSVPNLVRQTY